MAKFDSLKQRYREWFPKRKTPWPYGTKRQWYVGGAVCIGFWLVLRAVFMGAFYDLKNLFSVFQMGQLDSLLLFGIIIIIWAWKIKEQPAPNSKKSGTIGSKRNTTKKGDE